MDILCNVCGLRSQEDYCPYCGNSLILLRLKKEKEYVQMKNFTESEFEKRAFMEIFKLRVKNKDIKKMEEKKEVYV